MKIVPIEKSEMTNVYRKTKNLKILDEFLESGYEAVRVIDDSNRGAHLLSRSLQQSIKWFGLSNRVIAIKRKDNVYLVKKKHLNISKELSRKKFWLFSFFFSSQNLQPL